LKENYPNLTIKDIQDWVATTSFRKGESYFQQDAIMEPRRQGMTIKARCSGSSAPSYRVEVALDEKGIARAECSCPVGASGHCKHIAALLLTWLDNPESFAQIADTQTTLEERSKAELIVLIRQMLQRYPDLDYLLQLPLPIKCTDQTTINPAVIRRQVSHAFGGSYDEWSGRDLFEAARDLDELLNLAGQYLEQASHTNAAMIYRVVAEEILLHEDLVTGDVSDRLGELVDDCVEGLGNCLESINDTDMRQDILLVIFNMYLWDIKMGGVGIGDNAPEILLENATTQEKELLAGLIHSALPEMAAWGQEILGGLLLDLQAESLDDESFIEICRRSGRTNDLVNRLLRLGRLEEAICETEKAEDYRLLTLADLFVQHGYGAAAEQQVHTRAETSRDFRLLVWLKEYAIQQEDLTKALEMAKRLFCSRLSVNEYLSMKKLSVQINQWTELRIEMLDKLSQNKRFCLLVEIYLEETEIDQALKALEQARVSVRPRWEYPHSSEILVAKAAEESRPEQAIQLYLNQIKRLINIRGRGNYNEAIKYLKVVQGLYKRLGRLEDWKALLISLRQENRMLRAFHDELNKAGF
jgi:uncharacterized Zn finger protein